MADQNDVEYGYGHIPWGRPIRAITGELRWPAGWVLPGGERTTNRDEAQRVAVAIDDEFVRAGTRPGRFVNPHNKEREVAEAA